jgi:acetylornithine deacetylase/succinyl-diaminopimelate desuccinylase family protein
MPTAQEEAVLQSIDGMRSKLVELTQQLIRERSVNPPGDETGTARVLADELTSIGLRVKEYEAAPRRVNVEANLSGVERGLRFLFNGHMDVVPEGDLSKWTVDPFGGVVKGDLLYGRGTTDMKGGLAAVAIALRGLVESKTNLNGDVLFHAVADEEVDSVLGTKYMIAKGLAKADMGIVAEPSVFGGSIVIRQAVRGNCWIRLRTAGRAAHASNPTAGVNAVLNMSRLLLALDSLQLKHTPHKILPGPTISAGTVIKGGTKTNVMPETCESEVDVRITPGITKEQVLQEFMGVIDQLRKERPDFSATVDMFAFAPPAEIPENNPGLTAARKATELVVGRPPALGAAYGTNDGVYLIHDGGVPVVPGFGPGDHETGHAHGADENVRISDLLNFAKIYALTTMLALGYKDTR